MVLKKVVAKKIIVLAMLGLSACSSSSGGGDNSPGSNTVQIGGTVLDGIVMGGVVNAFLVNNDNGLVLTATGPTAYTQSDGTYTLNVPLPDGYDGPIMVKVTLAGASDVNTNGTPITTTMKDVYGGPDIPLTSANFVPLSAMKPEVKAGSDAVTAHISWGSTIGANFVLQDLDLGSTLTPALVDADNKQLFSLIGQGDTFDPITVTKVYDLSTQADIVEALNDPSSAASLFALMGEQINSACQARFSTASDCLDSLMTNTFSKVGQTWAMQGTSSDANVIAATDLVNALVPPGDSNAGVIGKLLAAHPIDNSNLVLAQFNLAATTARAVINTSVNSDGLIVAGDMSGSTTTTAVETTTTAAGTTTTAGGTTTTAAGTTFTTTSSPTSTTTTSTTPPTTTTTTTPSPVFNLDLTKAMVKQIRGLASSLGTVLNGSTGDTTGQLNIVNQIASLDAQGVVTTAGYSVLAMGLVVANETMPASPSASVYKTITISGISIPVIARRTSTGYHLIIDAPDIQGATVDLKADLSQSAYDTIQAVKQGDIELTQSDDAQLELSGTVANSGVELSLDEGSQATIVGEVDASSSGQGTLAITATALNLNVTLTQRPGTEITTPVSFTGTIAAELNDINALADDTSGVTGTFGPTSLTLNGTFADSDGHSFTVVLVLVTDGSTIAFTDLRDFQDSDHWLFSLTMIGALPGLNTDAKLTITGDRQTFNGDSGTVKLSYQGKSLTANLSQADDNGNRTVTIINHDNVHLILTVKANGDVSGIITVNGIKYADVVQVSLGIKTTYSDGTGTIN